MILSTLEPDFLPIVQNVLNKVSTATGTTWLPTSGRRTMAEQTKLYAQGRTEPGEIVTKAQAGSSAHNFGLAVDCCPCKEGGHNVLWWTAPQGYWDVYGAIAKEEGLIWGGGFKSIVDNPHIEHPRWKIAQAKWKAGELVVA